MRNAKPDELTLALKTDPKRWIGLVALVLCCLLTAFAASPRPDAGLLWIVDVYGLMVAGSLIAMTILSGQFGKLRLLLVGAAAFGAASILAASGPGAKTLVGSRPVQAMAAAILAPFALSLLHAMFPDPKERTLAMSVWTSSFALGAVIGPSLGGLILDHFWSSAVVFINIVAIALLLALSAFRQERRDEPDAVQMDTLSALLSPVAALSTVFGFESADDEEDLLPSAIEMDVVAVYFGWPTNTKVKFSGFM